MKKKICLLISLFFIIVFFGIRDHVFATYCDEFQDTEYRKTISLNGVWDFNPGNSGWTTFNVPDCWKSVAAYKKYNSAVYRTYFDVPSNFSNKIMLEFEAVNDIATIIVNGQTIKTHYNKDVKFIADITNYVDPGDTNVELTINVSAAGIDNVKGVKNTTRNNLGIRGNVYLKCFPDVRVKDCFIQTSYRNSEITFQYEIVNATNTGRTITVNPVAYGKDDLSVKKTFTGESVTLSPWETRTVTITRSWTDPDYWSPTTPQNRYILRTCLLQGDTILDEQKERFGFREFYRIGTNFYLNGCIFNLRGDNLVDQGVRMSDMPYGIGVDNNQSAWYNYFNAGDPATSRFQMEQLVDRLLDMNFNSVRTHIAPACDLFYQICDEKGLLVTCETPMLWEKIGENNVTAATADAYIKEFVASFKNHPSIVMWSIMNEADADSDFASVEASFDTYDPTRPNILHEPYSEESSTSDAVITHYTYGHNKPGLPRDLYDIKLPTTKVRGEGEFGWVYDYPIFNPSEPADAWKKALFTQGWQTRAFRYAGYGYIRPYRMNWAWKFNWENPETYDLDAQRDFVKKSMAAVAVYDKAYDGSYVYAPNYPVLKPGTTYTRNLIIYNDEYYGGTDITVNWWLKNGTTTYASGSFSKSIANGNKAEQAISFTTPNDMGKYILVLEAKKGTTQKYNDDSTYYFYVNDYEGVGYTIKDDYSPEVKYGGTWNYDTSDTYYHDSTRHFSNTEDSYAECVFEGPYIAVYSKKMYTGGMFDVYIDGVYQTTVDTYNPTNQYKVKVYENAGLGRGTHTIKLVVTGEKNQSSANYWLALDYFAYLDNAVSSIVDDYSSHFVYGGSWYADTGDAGYYNGTRHYSNTVGSSVEYLFDSSYIAIYAKMMSKGGKFDVYIDGEYKATIDTYSDTDQHRVKVYENSNIGPGLHTFKILLNGDKNPNSTNYWVGFDYIVRSVKIDDFSSAITYGGPSWTASDSDSNYYKSTRHVTASNGSYAQYTFYGTDIAVYVRKLSAGGQFDVYIDDVYQETVNTNDSSGGQYKAKVYEKTGLSQDYHTIKIVFTGNTGQKYLCFDYFESK